MGRDSVEAGWELGDDAGAELVGHHEDVGVDALIVGDARGILAVELVGGLRQRLVEVFLHVGAHHGVRPGARVRRGQEVGDVVAVGVSPGVGGVESIGVAGLGGLQELDGDGDVVVQQGCQLVARGGAVERFDRVADIALVLQQPP